MEHLGKHLSAARFRSGLTQHQLGIRTGMHQAAISQMEKGKRLPTLSQLKILARTLGVSLQWFLTGSNNSPTDIADLALQLRNLGIADLHVENTSVPGAFRHNEEVMVLAVAGNTPSARILEAMPAALSWNSWNPMLLSAFADLHDPRAKYRLGWLADIAITIHRNHGFPGGCTSLPTLETYIRLVTLPTEVDSSLEFPEIAESRPPVSRRWKIGYPAQLASFQKRAESLQAIRVDERSRFLNLL